MLGPRRQRSIVALWLVAAAAGACQTKPAGGSPDPAWTLVWSDEFDGGSGVPADGTRWSAVVGGDGWGNREREYYTDRLTNVQQRDGNLVIHAIEESSSGYTCWYGPCQYTSARLQTKARFDQRYGRFEARIKIPSGRGLWSAFWLLGNDIDATGWPSCGEIDVMENIGSEPGTVHATLHGPGYSGANGLTAAEVLAGGRFADDFHVFAVEWEANAIRSYVDDTLYETRTPGDLSSGNPWVFDHPFFVLLNLAVGGDLPGDPDQTTVFPQAMLVDYVRVYRRP